MDLYSASNRLSAAFRLPEEPLGLGRYGLIGDGYSAALVGVDGSIDWLCLPSFDSPSVFSKILDAHRGGSFRVSPLGACDGRQAYDDDTNVLQTLFHQHDHGVVGQGSV